MDRTQTRLEAGIYWGIISEVPAHDAGDSMVTYPTNINKLTVGELVNERIYFHNPYNRGVKGFRCQKTDSLKHPFTNLGLSRWTQLRPLIASDDPLEKKPLGTGDVL